jgi:hypothetical protein
MKKYKYRHPDEDRDPVMTRHAVGPEVNGIGLSRGELSKPSQLSKLPNNTQPRIMKK